MPFLRTIIFRCIQHSRWCNAHGVQVSQGYQVMWSCVSQSTQNSGFHSQCGLDLGLQLSCLAGFLYSVIHEVSSLGGSDGLVRTHCWKDGMWSTRVCLRGNQSRLWGEVEKRSFGKKKILSKNPVNWRW